MSGFTRGQYRSLWSGRQTRDFIFVADAVTAFSRDLDAQVSGASVFNKCTGRAVSVLGLAQTIASLCSQDLSILFRPARDGEIKHSYRDPTLAKEALGLPDPTELKIGLAATLARSEECLTFEKSVNADHAFELQLRCGP